MSTINLHASRAEVWRMLQKIVNAFNGDTTGIIGRLKLRVGVALLSQIQQDFIRKSRGETGKDGIKWQPLKRETIAQRRTTAGERKAAGVTRAHRNRGLLTDDENRQWKELFVYRLSRLRADMPEREALAKAAAFAWQEMKLRGAKTKLTLYGDRKVDILRDTGELLRSFSPGTVEAADPNFVGPTQHPDGQIFRVDPHSVTVGSNKKPWHHRGIQGRLPARPFWPLDGEIPAAWMPALHAATSRGISEAFAELAAKKVR